MNRRVQILGVTVDALTLPEALKRADQFIASPRFAYIVTPNPEFVMQAQKDTAFREWLNCADLSLADGVGLLWAAYFQSAQWPRSRLGRFLLTLIWLPWSFLTVILAPKKITCLIPERLSGADVLVELTKLAAQRKYKVFFFGGGEGVAQKSSRLLKFLYPSLRVVGAIAGPPFQSEAVALALLKDAQPDLIFLAVPQSQQREWTEKIREILPQSCTMGIGGALDFIVGATALQDPTGKYKAVRAPYWMRQRGLEWLWRLFKQPWRAGRIFQAVVRFTGEIVKESFTKR